MSSSLSIGQVAKAAGVNVDTIRYRQRLATLEEPARLLAAEKLALVETRLADLGRMRSVLKELIAHCDVRRGKIACPIIATLSHGGRNGRP